MSDGKKFPAALVRAAGNFLCCGNVYGSPKTFRGSFNTLIARAKVAFFASAPSSEQSAALSHCRKAAMLACALRSSSSQKSHSVAIFGNPVRAHYTAWAVLRKRVNFARFIKSNSAFQNRILNKRPQFAVCLRLNSERVNLRDFLIREALKDRAKREKQMQSRRRDSLRRRTFGCLFNHGNFFHLF